MGAFDAELEHPRSLPSGLSCSVAARKARNEPSEKSAVAALAQHGALLVYPIANRAQPPSLWSVFYPEVEMRWAWDQGADPRVVNLWHMRERLARSRAVVYGKWYKGRAVFFSHSLFAALLALTRANGFDTSTGPTSVNHTSLLSQEARELLKLLEEDSPQSSKALRQEAGLSGRHNERTWTHAMRMLWERFLIVGTGEVEDGAFPSLAVGATRSIFEEMWEAAEAGPTDAQLQLIEEQLPASSHFGKHLRKLCATTAVTKP